MRLQFVMKLAFMMLHQSKGNRNIYSVSVGDREGSRTVDNVQDDRIERRKIAKSKKSSKSKTIKGKKTAIPSGVPSKEPTSFPSSNPTVSSSPSLSHMPSSTPSSIPSRMPSSTPSSKPSSNPTRNPSSVPSSKPSLNPTSEPTNFPSSSPSSDPSSSPTYRPSSAPSSIPTTEPSPSPSSHPSSDPSSSPTDQPSSTPSSTPTAEPSPSPSSHPSSDPSSSPTYQPSSAPSSTPTASPSIFPSLLPSLYPSLTPSEQPSTAPSLAPSISSKPSYAPSLQPSSIPSTQPTTSPSLAPSASQAPSMRIVSGRKEVRGENGELGFQSGCPTPQNSNDANYAEDSVTRFVVSFRYSMTTTIGGSIDWDDLISTIDITFYEKLFKEYVNCNAVRRLSNKGERYMVDLDQANTTTHISGGFHPIGVASLPKDTKLNEIPCSEESINCVVNGGVTFLFERNASFSKSHQQLVALAAIKGLIDGMETLTYMGMDDTSLNNVDVIIPFVNRSQEIVDTRDTVTTFGVIVFIAVTLLFVAAAAALFTMKKRSSARYDRHEEILLSDQENNYSEEATEVSAIQNDALRLDSRTSREGQNITDAFVSDPNFHNIPHDNEFKGPDDYIPLHELIGIDGSSQLSDFSTQYCTQVRRCVSATCEVCRQNVAEKTVRFVSVRAGEGSVSIEADEGGIEVVENLRSPSSLCRCRRSYETPDTVDF